MLAFAFDDFGKAPSLRSMPTPAPESGEVRVRVQATSLNAFDLLIAAGYMKGRMEHRFPIVLGRDFAGVVDAVGPGTTSFAIGDDVFGVVMKPYLADGSFAEFVTVSTGMGIARRPKSLPVEEAGALGVAGTTALAAIEALAPSAGQTILISGAAGGVGSFAVQLAAARGARVIATAKPNDGEYVRSLGAAVSVDPGALESEVRRLAPNGVDAAAHLAGDARTIAGLVAKGGRFASTAGAGPQQLGDLPITATAIMGMPSNDSLSKLGGLGAEGRLRVPISWTYSFEQLPQAFANFARGGKHGKLGVRISAHLGRAS